MYWLAVALLGVSTLSGAHAQLTAQTSVAPELRECYLNTTLLNRNNLPPTSMSVLIDIIQQIEDNPNVNMDLRQLAVLLLHTYRQDGIEYHQPDSSVLASATVLPYSPTFHAFYRLKLLLTKLIPNNLQVLSNDIISSDKKCALHNMLSISVDARLRGDESSCNQLSQYRALRAPRGISSVKKDVEVLDRSVLESANKLGHMRQYNPNNDVEYTSYGGLKSERQLAGDSQCPLLKGVVSTPWGAVAAGSLIAGIAAGAEAQSVPLLELTKGSVLNDNYANMQNYVTTIYPATLSGDLAEAILIQRTERGSTSISVGVTGGWNSTQARRFYMLQTRENVEMTDPEIRGDVDGFYLGSTLSSTLSTFSSLKLSQLLDMYYSPRNGVYNSQVRACNRRELSQQVISSDTLTAETYAFCAALDTNMPLRGTITSGLQELTATAVTNFQNYFTNNVHDVTCATTELSSSDYRMKTNLYLVLDAAWQYETVYPAISYILDFLEIGKYGSSVTLLNSFDGSIILNKTFSPADFHSHYTLARHQSLPLGVNLQTTYANIITLMQDELNNERSHNYVGGNGTALLFLLNTGNLNNNDQVLEYARTINNTIPDLRVLYATSSNQENNIWNLVRDMHNDIFTISLSSNGLNVDTALGSLLNRISTVNRRIINPSCGAEWHQEITSGTRQFDDFVEPGYINYYSVSPNYFYQNNDNRKIRITRSSTGVGSIIVCHSRTVVKPRQNGTVNVGVDENAIQCQTLTGSGNVEISLQHACDGYWTINTCPNLYVSVQSEISTTTTLSAVCTDTHACRFPYNIRYVVQIEELGCFSSGINVQSNFFVMVAAVLLSFITFRH